MQLMTFNSLLMFDIVFIFFLFLVAVTCLMYYLPPSKIKRKSHFDKRRSQQSITVASSNSSKSVLFINGDNEPIESFIKCCKYCEKCKLIYEEIYSERSYDPIKAPTTLASSSNCSYLKAKDCDTKNCKGPIYEVMYSSIETPLAEQKHHHHENNNTNNNNKSNANAKYQYHNINAFNTYSTASAVSKFSSSLSSSIGKSPTGANNNECVKSIITPSNESHEMQQSSTLYNTRNKFSYGAYIAGSNNNNNDVTYSKSFNCRTTMVNDKIKLRGPYLQYKLSEKDNNGNYQKLSILDNGVKTNDKIHHHHQNNNNNDNNNNNNDKNNKNSHENAICTTILPRAKITLANSLLDASGVDYNLRTQTIGRYKPKATSNDYVTCQKPVMSDIPTPFVPSERNHHAGYNFYTLPSTRRESKNLQQQQQQSQKRNVHENKINHVSPTPSYVTLESALNFEFFHHLSPTQGWALLCQSIQALQDLFLSEPPSINRIMPVITPNNFLLTSRGRVVYGLLAIDKYNDSVNEYISDEFHHFIAGRKMSYNESDIEKMWIFSLGRTLMKTLPRTATLTSIKSMQSVQNQCAIVLQATIYKMCNFNSDDRASLMFLLNLNKDRATKRRQADKFLDIVPKFDYDKFNFTKIDELEVLFKRDLLGGTNVTFVINNSPLTKYHVLIVPQLESCLSQVMTKDSIEVALQIMKSTDDKSVRIGYNSPGALASVNHLHLHLVHVEHDLYVEDTIISDYCRNVHQSKPFSHIIMDLFKKVVQNITFPTLTEREERQDRESSNNNDVLSVESSNKDDIKSDTDSGRSSDYRDDNPLSSKPLSMDIEAFKYFSLPRPKYNSISMSNIQEIIPTPDYVKPKMRESSQQGNHQNARGGRRFTVDISSNDVATALADIGITKRAVSRSNSNLNAIYEGEMKISTLPNMKLKRDNAVKQNGERNVNDERELSGPEFIIDSNTEAKVLDITDNKCLNKGTVKILLLNGKVYDIICDSISTTALKIFEVIIRTEQIHENYIFDLCALIGGDFVFLPADLKIYKVAPQMWIQSTNKKIMSENVSFTLYMRIKFFLPTLRMLSLESRHTLYLQLRKSVLENHIICTDDDLITLGGLALQAEVGDFQEEMKYIEYFTISQYLPDGVYQQQKELARYLRNSHYSKRGLHSTEAEHNFIRYLQRMKDYGFHYLSGIWVRDDKIELSVYIGIGLNGICIFERYNSDVMMNVKRGRDIKKCNNKRLQYEQFDWLEIENLCFSKQIFCIVVRKLNISSNHGSKNKDRVKFKIKMDNRKSFFAFNIASEHHKFYMKLKNSFMSIKSIADELNISLSNQEVCPELNIKIDKISKTSGPRVRNLKKSVLNDTRLMKLKDRILRRSKSTVCDLKRNAEQNANENNLNKEVERPQFPSMIDLSVRSPIIRNKVKMGTRVFSSSSSQLNKSFESLSENYQEMLRVDSWGALNLKHSYDEDNNEAKSEENNEAVVLHSSIKSNINQANNFTIPNETVLSSSLAEKFENLSCSGANDRILSQIKIVKCPVFSEHLIQKSQSLKDLAFSSNVDSYITGYSMGISIIQGQTDNYVYVREIIKNGPGDKAGIRIGDQIISVDGVSLLNLPYEKSLEILQNTGNEVNLIVSQVFNRKTMKLYNGRGDEVDGSEYSIINNNNKNNEDIKDNNKSTCINDNYELIHTNLTMTPSKSLPNLMNVEDYQQLPKIVAIIPKGSINIDIPNLVAKPPRAMGQSRKYTGALKYPATPAKKDLKLTISPLSHKNQLSLANESDSFII